MLTLVVYISFFDRNRCTRMLYLLLHRNHFRRGFGLDYILCVN